MHKIDIKKTILALGLALIPLTLCTPLSQAQSLSTDQIVERCSPSVAVVLIGDGEGVVTAITPAVAIRADGVFLVAYRFVRDAKQLQLRLKSGEIFDEVKLLGTDERRGVAAIKIQAGDLAAIAPVNYDALKIGDALSVFTHRPGKLWSISSAKVTGLSLADEVPGAGEGYKIVQFDGAAGDPDDGGVLFDAAGAPVALVTRENAQAQKRWFAVPLSNVKSLADAERSRSFGAGHDLKLPVSEAALKAARSPDDPLGLLQRSKTVFVETNTTFFKEQQLINELNKRKEIKDWGWVLMTGGSWETRNKADLIIELDHQILTFDFTFTVRHRKSSIVISAGKVIIADGASGARKMVDKIIKSISAVINPPPPKGK